MQRIKASCERSISPVWPVCIEKRNLLDSYRFFLQHHGKRTGNDSLHQNILVYAQVNFLQVRLEIWFLQLSSHKAGIWKMFLLSIFSQLSPTNHNLARRGLSDRQNTLNMTKLKVNAQVTAITTLLEHIGNMTAIIHGVHFTTRSSWRLSILIHEMFCYCVFTPYVFLMNTSDNKNRIIKYGWRNVLKNIMGKHISESIQFFKEKDHKMF